MDNLMLVASFIVMLLAGVWINKKIDSFISRYVVRYSGGSMEASEHERTDTTEAE